MGMWWEGGNRVNRKHYFVEWEQFFKFERIRARTTMATQITIKDIAKILGISVSTVSRALKNHPDISAETKKEVQELRNRRKENALRLLINSCCQFHSEAVKKSRML